ncbi:hypothetical protein, partial [Wolbachia endosymbiont of Pentidionis agamae]|uniref:hypothetical protein n=1 Tax=Wolbachia endosymbiont of Pentidionis agamae TaxID=3110435 RepID=UPI002FD4C5CA
MRTTSDTITINPAEVVKSTHGDLKPDIPYTKETRKYNYITLGETLKNISEGNEDKNNLLYLDENDEETKKFLDSVSKEIAAYTGNNSIEVRLRGRKGRTTFTAWISFKEDGKNRELKFDNSFPGEGLKDIDPKIGAFTLVSPEDRRIIRISQDKDGKKLYQVLNDSCTIKFNWSVGDKNCSITLTVTRKNDQEHYNDNDYDVVIDGYSEGLSSEDLKKNESVKIKIGYYENKEFDKYNNMSLEEVVRVAKGSQLGSSE